MRKLALLLLLLASPAAAQDCQDCGVKEAPASLTNVATIAGPTETGDRLVISGAVFLADGVTPAEGVIVYAYQTNAAGIYPKRGGEAGEARWHGYLRGWVRTDARGRYEFRTIRPGHYPGRTDPAHVHMQVLPRGARNGYYISDVVDTRDPMVDARHRAQRPVGGSGISDFVRDADGTWRVTRNIVLTR